ncbi:hypothetical protein A4H97_28285 [Niastella yeongjuensis]|uniref:DUF4932 domain-containing protein n=1 Tax=Niastella yeongjuensis TaxID=354355 RepID=A0A1V9EUG4_9BACT|nr:DUF4932 domain-containing protein [Niastella yeongjuensis]OQP49790.1 hypothetical protein A4H97_28285 [Niastella yeongjuensis]SEP40299.1 protein of unknown function [Niastella yeongjuensis]
MKKIIVAVSLVYSTAFSFAQDGKANFTKAFQQQNNGKSWIEINEVKELVHIMIAVTKFGLGNDDMVQQQGDYYQDVLKQFKPFQNEPILITFDSLLQKSPLNYVFLTGNAISYDFNNDTLLANDIYSIPADEVNKIRITENPITTYKTAIENFAKKSSFRQFYALHQPVYNNVISDYEKNANLGRQWKWLERNFTTRVNSYQILCSPLINGLNYTGAFTDGDFKLIQMILPPIIHNEKWTAAFTEAFNTRGMFTEIDHNYVRKPGEKYEKEINEALKDREKWVNVKVYGTEYYHTPLHVFNEYMTFAVFLLYCEEVFKKDPETLKATYEDVNGVMVKQRGFIKMKAFADYLVTLRNANKNKKIEALYPALVQWCAKQ